jgi:hypothetical protein
VIGNSVIAGPRINFASLPCYRTVPGYPLTLAIPGERLWRSTVVTLDGRKATQIEVMPNMEGLLATFDQFASDPASSVTRELSVWTSEGTDSVEISRCGTPPG